MEASFIEDILLGSGGAGRDAYLLEPNARHPVFLSAYQYLICNMVAALLPDLPWRPW